MVTVPVLLQHDGVDPTRGLQHLGALDLQSPKPGAPAGALHQRHRRRWSPSAHGEAMISTATAAVKTRSRLLCLGPAIRGAWPLCTPPPPTGTNIPEIRARPGDQRRLAGSAPPRPVAPCPGRAGGLQADAGGTHHQASAGVDRGTHDGGAGRHLHRHSTARLKREASTAELPSSTTLSVVIFSAWVLAPWNRSPTPSRLAGTRPRVARVPLHAGSRRPWHPGGAERAGLLPARRFERTSVYPLAQDERGHSGSGLEVDHPRAVGAACL